MSLNGERVVNGKGDLVEGCLDGTTFAYDFRMRLALHQDFATNPVPGIVFLG